LREKPSSTTHISPYTMIYGTLPKGPLSVLKESWAGERQLPFSIGKTPDEYLQTLKENLELAKIYADYYSDIEQKRYADHYNLRSTDRKFELGDKVIVLAPGMGGAKLYSRWQGPGTIIEVKSPYSYVVEVEGKRRHMHANKIRKFNERIERAEVNNCSVIFERDEQFGSIDVIPDNSAKTDSPVSSKIDPSKIAHLTNTEKKQLFEIIDKYPEVFSEKPGYCSLIEHEIKMVPDFKPKRLPAYKVPELLKPEVERQIQEMLELGIIVPSKSEMASPVVCVLKGPNGQNGVRLAIDFRYVNRYSAGDCFPTPDIAEVLQKVGRAKYISCFDAKSGYWQIPVKKEARWLTAFVCDAGLFEFKRMPFGLKSAGNTFIRCISRILHPIRDFTEPFVDDMAVLSSAWDEHLMHLDKFLSKIKESGMTLNLAKCSFAQEKATFVGHVVGSGQVEPDPTKIATVADLKPPTTKREVRRLIGFFSYFRSFIPSLAEKARILTDLTKKSVPNRIPWGPEHQQALDQLKTDLCTATSLHTIDFSKDFGLLVDASANAIGCCLIQWSEDGSEKPIAFASTKLSTTQSNWSTIEREAYAVIWALKKFRSWIFMSKVKVFSDHNPLSFLTEAAPKSAKLTRWALALQEFNVDFRYRSGRKHAAADFLSRI
jgi:RNase H-like domain found in reverse transcriptase/Reverse transcriptase (RNA-dependent DNA polymerase)